MSAALIGTTTLIVCVPVLHALGSSAGTGYELTRLTIGGGGAMRATGSGFELSGTIGQPDASLLTGDGFELAGGFWFPVSAGDGDEDGVVTLDDYDAFESCMTGPDASEPQEGCDAFDVDRSGTIDLSDFAAVQTTFDGQ